MAATMTTQLPRASRGPRRNYTAMWCIVLAVLPFAATEFGLIPVYESQRRILPASASFFCILGFVYVFSLRHGLAGAMFGTRFTRSDGDSTHGRHGFSINYLPAGLILASLGAAAAYLSAYESGRELPAFPALPRSSADAVVLALSFVAIFLLAETAFALMAVREYLQDVLGLTDAAIIAGIPARPRSTVPDSESESLSFSYRVGPPGRSTESQLAQFDSEADAAGPGETEDAIVAGHIEDVKEAGGSPRT